MTRWLVPYEWRGSKPLKSAVGIVLEADCEFDARVAANGRAFATPFFASFHVVQTDLELGFYRFRAGHWVRDAFLNACDEVSHARYKKPLQLGLARSWGN